jgi:regulation of enolase protein 1 (concanavalin A-like superfamily)
MPRNVLTLVLGVVALGAALAPAQQAAPTLKGWGQPEDPGKDCEIALDGTALVIEVPATPHDLLPTAGKRNAPRVTRDNEGNFAARVKVTGTMAPGSQQGAGLVLYLDERNFVRLELCGAKEGDAASRILRFGYWQDGRLQPDDELAVPATTAWIRMTRRINKLKAEISADGETWTEVKTIPIRLSSRMRLGAIATNTAPTPLAVRLEEYQVKGISLYPSS